MRTVTLILAMLVSALPGRAEAQVGSPAGPVPVELLKQRRGRLLDRIGDGVIVLRSARVQDMDGEDYAQASDFRQDNDFFYLTGLEEPGAWLVMRAHANADDEVVLFVQPRDPAQEIWSGPRIEERAASAITGIPDVRTTDRVTSEVAKLLSPGRPLYVKLPRTAQEICASLEGDERDACTWLFLEPIERTRVELRDIRPHTAALRLVKDADELRRLRRAIEITTDAHRVAMARATPGIWEYELEAAIEHTFHSKGAERVGFTSIIGSGPNSTALHYDKSRRRTEAGDLVVMDIGADFGYYTADVTRTIPVSGKFTARQRALYDLVLGAQQAAIEAIRPGMDLVKLDEIAREHMRKNSGRLCAPRTCDEYFVHGIGHWLGMDVHDPAEINTPFAAGMVLTVEPGIYIPAEAVGIRIEDDVLVTSTGYEVLSTGAPRTADEVEQAMAQAIQSVK
jgi:Xaa-Pro aminopeptidase